MRIDVTAELIYPQIIKRKQDTHKGDYGRVLILAGSRKYTGAPFFAAQAAVNSGSGIVSLALPKSIYPILAQKLNEPIFHPLHETEDEISESGTNQVCELIPGYDACLLGPGLGSGGGVSRAVRRLLTEADIPLVLDADALNSLSSDTADLLKKAKRHHVLTPHEGEFKRLFPEFDRARREECAQYFAEKHRCILVLKGHRTVTALPDGRLFINTTGNPGMAKGGSGDVLAGIIISLIGQGIDPAHAAYIGVWLHGASGDICQKRYGEYGMTPTDLLDGIKFALKGCDETRWDAEESS